MSDDGSITVASRLHEAEAHDFPDGFLSVDLLPILGESAWIVSENDNIGLACAVERLARLIDPTTRQAADGTCVMCGAPAEALRDAYCAHCGRRIVRNEEDER